MRRLSAILAVGLLAALLHFGAMAGFGASSALSTSHSVTSAHHDHAMPGAPVCPIGSVCPLTQSPNFGSAGSILLVTFAALALFIVRLPHAPSTRRYAFAAPFSPPNDPRTLLAVFKRE